ncbi:hypothetical protein I6E50_08385 [Roseburia hominis]|uniref:hypothetical protein n=1 Tax=Roseburia hominis TaxID=301301 RepID=UPI001F378AEA|nr:hypothetical protein [Roseburia hominis]
MEEKIIQLYEDINYIGYCCVYGKKNDYVKRAKSLIPDIQEFVTWFTEKNQFGIEDTLYQALKNNMFDILKDCIEAFQQEDRVLLLDALEYGVAEYLKMFLPENYIEERNK